MPALLLHIPQPCSESWAATTPTAAGRHCAACQKTVIDFTQLSDAEILEQLARAGTAGTCGQFRGSQLERPLKLLVAPAPARWRTWLAAAVAIWGLREGMGLAANAQVRSEQRPTAVPAPTPEQLQLKRRDDYEGMAPATRTLRGVVLDATTGEVLPGVSVVLHGSTIATASNADGEFTLAIPTDMFSGEAPAIDFRYLGYLAQTKVLADFAFEQPLYKVALEADFKGMTGEVVVTSLWMRPLPPAPWHPRRLYYWGKYWLTRPFRSH